MWWRITFRETKIKSYLLPSCVNKSLGEVDEYLWIFNNSAFKAPVRGPGLDMTETFKGA